MIIPIEKMRETTRSFYSNIGCELTDDNIDLAVQSLTMPCYANEYAQKYGEKILNHSSLATVGDAYWEVYILAIAFEPNSKKGNLTNGIKQTIGTNEQMNPLAEKWLNRFLFAANNDLKDNNSDGQNTKGYATALEAVIGFLFLKYPEKVFGILRKQFSDEIILNNRK